MARREATQALRRRAAALEIPIGAGPSAHELSCQQLTREAVPQPLFRNLAVAPATGNAFRARRQGKRRSGEVYPDLLEGKTPPPASTP